MDRLRRGLVLGVALACVAVCPAKETGFTPDLARINDSKIWKVLNAEFSTSVEDGKNVVQLKPKGVAGKGSLVGVALVEGVQFMEGTIEVDLKGNGKTQTSFPGVAFGAADDKTFEAVYFRPFNFLRDDKAFRVRAVQYVAWPGNPWEKLRKETPGVYESAVKPVPDPAGWFHARVEVTKKKVRVFVNDAKEPCLVVDRLVSPTSHSVGLWVDSREGAFANLKISPAK
jgi:hypothetical protein